MTNRLPITLDCIIFGLQPLGGISHYWAKLVEYVSTDRAFAGSLVLPKHMIYGDFDAAWSQRMPVLREMFVARVTRYLSAPTGDDSGVFHTSYYRLPRKRVRKFVVSVYDFTYERCHAAGLARYIHTKQKLASIRRADAVLCISESTRRDVIDQCPDIDISKLHVTPLGVDGKVFYQESADQPNADEQTVLFVGKRVGYKRFDLAVEAVRQLPRLSLGVAGPGLTFEERTLLQARLGCRWQEFGPVSNADLRKLYSSAYAFIFPSDYEGFGLPILEAMACGCPVVAAPLSSFPEVGGTAAHYAERQSGESYASALSALDSRAVREDTIRRGLARALEFNWLQTLQVTKEIYLDE
jgi:mannosyltransferase